jgi:cardiolipin synthase
MKKNIPNIISIIRIILTIPFIVLLNNKFYSLVMLIFPLIIISDFLDGFIARKTKNVTKIGVILDPIADKILLISTFIVFYYINIIPSWFFWMLILKDISLSLGSAYIYYLNLNIDFSSILISKFNTVLQFIYIAYIVLVLNKTINYSYNISYLIILIAIMSFISLMSYFKNLFVKL